MVNEKVTNEDGTCTIEGVEKGTLTINVSKEGFVEASQTINVTSDATVNFTLEEDEEEEIENRIVEFSVRDSEETGISGARITLTNAATNETSTNANGGTGSSGGSNITLDYGTYNVTVTKTDYVDATFELDVDAELTVNGENVSINAQGKVVVVLTEE